jgi:hypothetical protein
MCAGRRRSRRGPPDDRKDEVVQQLGVAVMRRRSEPRPLVLQPPVDELAHRQVGRERVAPALHVVDQAGELGLRLLLGAEPAAPLLAALARGRIGAHVEDDRVGPAPLADMPTHPRSAPPRRPRTPPDLRFCGAPPGTRTLNPRIKSPLLCQIELEAPGG